MKKVIIILVFIVIVVILALWKPHSSSTPTEPAIGTALEKDDLIRVTNIKAGEVIDNPVIVKGEARGTWFFEATFPVDVVNWDGKIMGGGIAKAESDWMTEDYVPFTAEIHYIAPADSKGKRGSVILKKDNPSGDPQNDNALEIPVVIK